MKKPPISKEIAHALGLKMYYTGRPCKYKHDAERYVSSGRCSVCAKDKRLQSGRKRAVFYVREEHIMAVQDFINRLTRE